MHEEDVLLEMPGAKALNDFPDFLDCGNITLPLTYRFSPGAEDDGVTCTVSPERLVTIT